MTNEPVRCGVSFETVEEFRAAFITRGQGLAFVAYPDEVEPGRPVVIDVDLAQRVRLELEGTAGDPDFDERGNTGVLVALSEAAAKLVQKLDVDLRAGPVPEVFATTRIHKSPTAKIVGGAVAASANAGEAEPLLEPGTMVDERFRIEAHVATGGMGEVYRANHVHLKRPVALKLLRRVFASDAEMWARFQREAELVSQLESPNVVRIFDFGRTRDGQPYLAMEYVEGTTLDVLLAESGPLEPARATAMLAQVCEGLKEAHALGVIHRDLKPSNLILGRRRDGSELVKILDFGIARMADQSGRTEKQKLTQLGIVVGTPAYIAPEQALADDLDHRTDIYSLGCVAYELLTGHPPFRSPDLPKVLSMHLTTAPAPLESVRPELAAFPALCAAVLKALSKERERRFADVSEFARALTVSTATTTPLPAVELQPAAPVDDWPPISAPSQVQPVDQHAVAAVDDFFGTPSPSAPPAPASKKTPETVAQRLVLARQRVPAGVTRAAWLYLEVLGVPPESPEAHTCLTRALEAAEPFGAFGEMSDEDGVLVGFAASAHPPTPRAALAALAMREAVIDEGARLNVATARLRAALVVDDFQAQPNNSVFMRARALAGRVPAGSITCERLLSPEVAAAVEVTNQGDSLTISGRRALRRPPGELVGRGPTFEVLERRLAGLQQGVVAPIVLRGAPGSGRTAVALELAQRARRRSLVVVQVSASPAWARRPNSLIAALVCGAVGIPVEARTRLLRSALEALKLPAPVIEAALVVCGVTQPTWAFTAGQAAHALRAVLRAGAGERPVVLIVDGLEHVDEQGLEAFGELVTRPAARELTIGFASSALAHEKLAGAAVADLPLLTALELGQLVKQVMGAPAGPWLASFLGEAAKGLPAPALELLAWLEERGALRVGANVEVVDDVPSVPPEGMLARTRLAVQPVDLARVLEAAVCQGESFDAAGVMTAFPRATQAVVAQAALGRFMPVAGRRWAFQRHRDAEAVQALPSPERAAMHQRLALAQVEVGRANPANVDPLDVGMHFVAAGDAVRAVALLQHAAEVALIRHAPRDAALALKGLADALGLAGERAAARRVESLARAGALALSAHDAGAARAYVDEALALAGTARVESAELWLVQARVLRSEARRARAAEALSRAEAGGVELLAPLVSVERAESFEQEGDNAKAAAAFEAALSAAEPSLALARWHGEIDLIARVGARLGALSLQKKDAPAACRLFEASAARWRAVQYPAGEARALSNLGVAAAAAKDLATAVKCFGAAAEAAAGSGDFLFQTRALLQLAKAQKKVEPGGAAARTSATEARRLAVALGWEQGRLEASALIET